jgi:hypothetical protein
MPTPAMCSIPDHLLSVIRGEYAEMPGMRLTRAQFRRLWLLDETECDGAIRVLTEEGFLDQDRAGRLHRVRDVVH